MTQGKRLGRGALIMLGLPLLALLAAAVTLAVRDEGSLLPSERATEAVPAPAPGGPTDGEAAAVADPGPTEERPDPAATTAAQDRAAGDGAAPADATEPEATAAGEPEPVEAPAYRRWMRALAAAIGGDDAEAPAAGGDARVVEAVPDEPAAAARRGEADGVAPGPARRDAAPAPPTAEAAPPGFDLDAVVAALTDEDLLVPPPGETDAAAGAGTADEEIDLEALVAALEAEDWAAGLLGPEPGGDAAADGDGEPLAADRAFAWAEFGDPAAAAAPGERRAPTFDIVRVASDGRAVIAGRAEPGEVVEVRVDERVVDRVAANRRGQWVSLPDAPLAVESGEMTLRSLADGAPPLPSDQVVVLALPRRADAPSAGAAAPAAFTGDAAARPRQALAVLLPKEGTGAGRLLQAPGGIRAGAGLALRAVDYDNLGRVRLAGEARPGATVRVHVDGAPAAEARADDDGAWLAHLDRRLGPGRYTLRVEQLDADGGVLASLETPFSRAAGLPQATEPGVDHVIVQPGNSLWRISRRVYGDGFHYVEIYDANRSQIADPNLIYPGQILGVPQLD